MKYSFAGLTYTLCAVWLLLLPVPLSNATTSWHAYDADLVKSKSSLKECLIYENSTRPQRQDSASRKIHKTKSSGSLGLWQGNCKVGVFNSCFLLMSTVCQIWTVSNGANSIHFMTEKHYLCSDSLALLFTWWLYPKIVSSPRHEAASGETLFGFREAIEVPRLN